MAHWPTCQVCLRNTSFLLLPRTTRKPAHYVVQLCHFMRQNLSLFLPFTQPPLSAPLPTSPLCPLYLPHPSLALSSRPDATTRRSAPRGLCSTTPSVAPSACRYRLPCVRADVHRSGRISTVTFIASGVSAVFAVLMYDQDRRLPILRLEPLQW